MAAARARPKKARARYCEPLVFISSQNSSEPNLSFPRRAALPGPAVLGAPAAAGVEPVTIPPALLQPAPSPAAASNSTDTQACANLPMAIPVSPFLRATFPILRPSESKRGVIRKNPGIGPNVDLRIEVVRCAAVVHSTNDRLIDLSPAEAPDLQRPARLSVGEISALKASPQTLRPGSPFGESTGPPLALAHSRDSARAARQFPSLANFSQN
jgi:hypothetical protein